MEKDIRHWLQYEQTGRHRVTWEGFQASITVMELHLSPLVLPCVYQSVDAYIMLSRGEGWGRPYAEAMALHLPVGIGKFLIGPSPLDPYTGGSRLLVLGIRGICSL